MRAELTKLTIPATTTGDEAEVPETVVVCGVCSEVDKVK